MCCDCMSSSRLQFTFRPKGPAMKRNVYIYIYIYIHEVLVRFNCSFYLRVHIMNGYVMKSQSVEGKCSAIFSDKPFLTISCLAHWQCLLVIK